MSAAPRALDTASGITADRTQAIEGGGGSHASATFLVDVTGITRTTGSLTVTLNWVSASGAVVQIAEDTTITTAGITRLDLEADFAATRDAIPEPIQVVWDLIGDATAVSGTVYAAYGV